MTRIEKVRSSGHHASHVRHERVAHLRAMESSGDDDDDDAKKDDDKKDDEGKKSKKDDEGKEKKKTKKSGKRQDGDDDQSSGNKTSSSGGNNSWVDGDEPRRKSIPWRDMTSVVSLDSVGVMVVAGRTGTSTSVNGPYLTLGGAAFPNLEAELASNAKDIWVLRSSNGQFVQPTLEGTAVSAFGHSCVFYSLKNLVICTGGFSRTGEAKRLTLQIFRRSGSTFRINSFGVSENGPGMEGSENAGRGLHASTILGDKIYLFGGQPCLFCSSPTWGGINTAVIDMGGDTPMLSYVFATEESDEAPPSPALGTFSGSCAVSLPSGRALLVGGATKDGDNVSALPNVLWIFDPKTNGFRAVRTATGSAPSPRWGAACTYTRGIVYVHGGCDPSSSSGPVDPSTYMLNVTSFPWSWSKTDSGPNGPGPRCFGSASVYRNFVVFSGGQYGKADATISAGAGKKAGKASSARTPHQPLFSDNFEEDEVSSDSADSSLERRAPGDATDFGFYVFDRQGGSWVPPTAVDSLDRPPSPVVTSTRPDRPTLAIPSGPSGSAPSQPIATRPPGASNTAPAAPAGSGLNPGIITGIVIGALLLLAIVAALIMWIVRYRRSRNGFGNASRSGWGSSPGMTSKKFGKLPMFGSGGASGRRRPVSSVFGNTMRRPTTTGFRPLSSTPETSERMSESQFGGPTSFASMPASGLPIESMPPHAGASAPSVLASPPPKLERRATGMASTTALGARFFDPSKNTFIPLLAPIKDDFSENDEVIGQVTNSIAEELGDPSNIPLKDAKSGYLGLSLSSVPLRTYSTNLTFGGDDDSRNPFLDPRLDARQPGELALPPTLLGSVKFQVIYPYEPQAEGEVELRWGEVITVRKFFKDGWAIGYNETTMVTGAFPIFAIEEVEEPSMQMAPIVEAPVDGRISVSTNDSALMPNSPPAIEPLQSGDTVSRGGIAGGGASAV